MIDHLGLYHPQPGPASNVLAGPEGAHKPLYVTQSWPAQPAWMSDAACQYVDPDLMFPDQIGGQIGERLRGGSASSEVAMQYEQAKWVCRRCPVKAECLEYALERDEEWGVWGGMSRSERIEESERREADKRLVALAA